MEPKFAQLILAMRPCVNELLINVCEQPDTLRTCDFNRFCVKNIVERISSLYYRSNEVNDVNKIMRHQTAISFPDVEEILERNDFVNGDFVPDLEASKVQVSESSKVGAHSLQYLKSCDVDLSIFQFDFETIEKESGSKEMVERDVGLKVFSEKGNEVAEKDIEIMETTDEIVKKSCNIPENSGEIIEKINESATECGDVAEKGSVEEKCETVAISTGPAKITEMSQSIYAGFVPIARKNNSTDDSLGSNKHAKLQGKQLLNIQSLNHHINMHEAPNHCDNIDKKFQEPFQRERNVILNDTEDIIGKPVAGFVIKSQRQRNIQINRSNVIKNVNSTFINQANGRNHIGMHYQPVQRFTNNMTPYMRPKHYPFHVNHHPQSVSQLFPNQHSQHLQPPSQFFTNQHAQHNLGNHFFEPISSMPSSNERKKPLLRKDR